MVFNATFNNISGISWRSKVTDKLYHIMLVVIAIDCTGSCKSNICMSLRVREIYVLNNHVFIIKLRTYTLS
jgi:ABC-type microcin C transport system permease subunit YejB